MLLAAELLIGGLAILGVVVAARWWEAVVWRSHLVAFRLRLPASLTVEEVARWLATVSATTHAPRWSLLPLPPVGIEIVATTAGVSHFLLVKESTRGQVLAGLRAALPGVRVEEAPEHVALRPRVRLAGEWGMTSWRRPLAVERADLASHALLSALLPLSRGEEIRVQFVATSAGTPQPVPSKTSGTGSDAPWWLESSAPPDADAVRAERSKQREPWLHAVLRIGVVADDTARSRALFSRVWSTAHSLNAPGVRLVRRWLPSWVVANRLVRRAVPVVHWPLLVNVSEAVGLVGFPVGSVHLPGLALRAARQLPPAPTMPRTGLVVAASNYPGMSGRPLALRPDDRLRHMYVLGPTGSGKSWLIARMVLQDIAAGRGVFCVDVKGDLVGDILDRIGDADAERVIVVDPSRRDHPVGFNVLGHAGSEEARELVVDNILHVFRSIWAAYWGPRSDQVLRGALSTLVSTRPVDGSAFTLCEIVPLLTQPAFRRFVTGQPTLPESLVGWWQWYDGLSDGERIQAIGPVLNKVEAFTQRTPIRLLLGQSEGIDLSTIFRDRAAVLVSLVKGTLGSETSSLLGALLVSALWDATLARVRISAARRRSTFAYIDEAADIVRMPLGIAEMLAQARGLGLGMVLATQVIAQLPEAVKAAVLGTVRTTMSFAVDYDDAKVLEKRFAPLTVDDLTGLDAWEVALRPCVDGRTLSPVTGMALPLDGPSRDGRELATQSRHRYGLPRTDVEAGLRARIGTSAPRLGRFGRLPGGAA